LRDAASVSHRTTGNSNGSQFCSGFQWVGTDDAGRLVTPWRYDDGDQVVVFARREGSEWRVDDNGEGLFRLAAAGVVIAATSAQRLMEAEII
jgi:hypothetical protein